MYIRKKFTECLTGAPRSNVLLAFGVLYLSDNLVTDDFWCLTTGLVLILAGAFGPRIRKLGFGHRTFNLELDTDASWGERPKRYD